MSRIYNHEKLDVYQRALAFYAEMDSLIDDWDPRHSIRDHLLRAAESAVQQLAHACAAPSHRQRNILDYSLGSVMECGACLDIAKVKSLASPDYLAQEKDELVQIFRMMWTLGKSWDSGSVREAKGTYEASTKSRRKPDSFYHERLDVYKLPLAVMQWFVGQNPLESLSSRMFRKVDGTLTSVLLNIAEGNGRRSEDDKQRFMETAYESSIKAASFLDICLIKGVFTPEDVERAKDKLHQVTSITASMAGIGKD
mgnify:CR=1 FL=1